MDLLSSEKDRAWSTRVVRSEILAYITLLELELLQEDFPRQCDYQEALTGRSLWTIQVG